MKIEFYPGVMEEMVRLVTESPIEIGWYGVCERIDDIIEIKEILVYPQKCGPASVTTNGLPEYDQWLLNLDVEKANKIRFAGHSHVNMAAVPSGIDKRDEEATLSQLEENDYYLFFILNKRGEWDLRYYDGLADPIEWRGDGFV